MDIDALLYVDTDVVFLAPLEELWRHFQAMNSSHLAAMAPEHEDLATGWYNRFAKHPYYGRLGNVFHTEVWDAAWGREWCELEFSHFCHEILVTEKTKYLQLCMLYYL